MKKRKAAFHHPWPMIIEESDTKQNEISMIRPYYQAMKRYERFKRTISDNRTIKKMQLTVDKIFSVREEYHDIQTTLSKRKIMAGLLKSVEVDNLNPRHIIMVHLEICGIITYRIEPKEILAIHRALGTFYDNFPDTKQVLVDYIRQDLKCLREPSHPVQMALYSTIMHVPSYKNATKYVCDYLDTVSDFDIIAILEHRYEHDVVKDALNGAMNSPKLFGKELEELESYVEALDEKMESRNDLFSSFIRKMDNLIQNILEPITPPEDTLQSIDGHLGTESSFLSIMILIQHQTLRNKIMYHIYSASPDILLSYFSPTISQEKIVFEEFEGRPAIGLSSSPQYWYFVLLQILVKHGAIKEDVLVDNVIPLLIDLIKHPKQLKKTNHDKSLRKVKAVLYKFIAPVLIGFHPELEDALTDENKLREMEDRNVIHIFATHISNACRHWKKTEGRFVNKRLEKSVFSSYKQFIGPHFDEIMSLYFQELQRNTPDNNISLDDLEVDFLESIFDMDGEQDQELAIPEENRGQEDVVDSLTPDNTPACDWYYVASPKTTSLNPKRFPADPQQRIGALEKIFRAHRNKPKAGIKTSSIIRAIEYFEGLSARFKNLMPGEKIAGQYWKKIKRGRVRILVRHDATCNLIFHIYQRKDWKYGMYF